MIFDPNTSGRYTIGMATPSPTVSIIIPTHNRTLYFTQALQSCLNQSYKDYEILVYDSSSHEEIRAIVDSFASPQVQFVKDQINFDITGKLNMALGNARGRWAIVLGDDDHFSPDCLETLIAHTQTYPDATLLKGRYTLINAKGNVVRQDPPIPLRMPPAEFLRRIFLPETKSFKKNISGILFPTALLKKLGGFVRFHKGWHMDTYSFAMMGSQGTCIIDEKFLCNVRLHAGAVTGSLDADYVASIETDIRMKKLTENLFNELAKKLETPEEKAQLAEARKNFEKYIRRHLNRSMDQGFLRILEGHSKNTAGLLKPLFQKMRDLGLPIFRSAKFYPLLALVPYPLRKPVVDRIKVYKISLACK